MAVSRFRLVLDPSACDGHGLCAELYPEGIALDDWGFPIIKSDVPDRHLEHARRSQSACPALALRLERTS
jgi:ferredoxin